MGDFCYRVKLGSCMGCPHPSRIKHELSGDSATPELVLAEIKQRLKEEGVCPQGVRPDIDFIKSKLDIRLM
jgi:hypothetical protein